MWSLMKGYIQIKMYVKWTIIAMENTYNPPRATFYMPERTSQIQFWTVYCH